MNSKKITDEYFQQEASHYIHPDKALLDAGCGKWGINDYEPYRLKNRVSVGLDASPDALQVRSCFDYRIAGLVEYVPFGNEHFDVILSYEVFEHIRDPEIALKEFRRVLKKGGGVIIATNSIYHPVMFLSAVLPTKIRDAIKKRFLLIYDDTFPTYYKFNNLNTIDRKMQRCGFRRQFATYCSTPYSGNESSIFNRMLFRLFQIYDRLTDLKTLMPFKMNIVIHYKKI